MTDERLLGKFGFATILNNDQDLPGFGFVIFICDRPREEQKQESARGGACGGGAEGSVGLAHR